MHALVLQRPAAQVSEQHSVDDAQLPPGAVHLLMEATQVADAGSQSPEQQSPPAAQVCPKDRQDADEMVSPTLGPSVGLPALPSGYLPTFAVLLQAVKASAVTPRTMIMRMELGMVTPREGSIDVWNESGDPSRNRLQRLVHDRLEQAAGMLATKARRAFAGLAIVALGDQGLNQQAVPFFCELAVGKATGVAVQGCQCAVEAATGQRGARHLDQVAFSGKTLVLGAAHGGFAGTSPIAGCRDDWLMAGFNRRWKLWHGQGRDRR
jgi:hypothetical protein